jgi:hypothetical protein
MCILYSHLPSVSTWNSNLSSGAIGKNGWGFGSSIGEGVNDLAVV